MKKILFYCFLNLLMVQAYGQNLPKASSFISVTQVVGVTEITLKYHRPNVKGRKIFGEVVPFGKVWRTGANQATTITLADDAEINGTKIKAGTYSLFTIPNKKEWTVLFNKSSDSWGTEKYTEENNVAALQVKPYKDHFCESLSIEFQNIGRNTAEVVIRWEKTAVSFTVKTDVESKVMANIEEAIANAGDNWEVYANCADYCLQNNIKIEQAGQWIDKALALNNKTYWTYWLKADYYALKQNYKDAVIAAENALRLGLLEMGEKFPYKESLQRTISGWKNKM